MSGLENKMDIEITTTKKKLTKSLISQMRIAHIDSLRDGEILGYLSNILKNYSRILLIKNDGEYFIFSCSWRKGEIAVYHKFGRFDTKIKFDNAEKCNDWWTIYQAALEKATTQIYI